MKKIINTSVTMPPDLAHRAKIVAAQLNVSRSELIRQALKKRINEYEEGKKSNDQ